MPALIQKNNGEIVESCFELTTRRVIEGLNAGERLKNTPVISSFSETQMCRRTGFFGERSLDFVKKSIGKWRKFT